MNMNEQQQDRVRNLMTMQKERDKANGLYAGYKEKFRKYAIHLAFVSIYEAGGANLEKALAGIDDVYDVEYAMEITKIFKQANEELNGIHHDFSKLKEVMVDYFGKDRGTKLAKHLATERTTWKSSTTESPSRFLLTYRVGHDFNYYWAADEQDMHGFTLNNPEIEVVEALRITVQEEYKRKKGDDNQ